MNWNPFNDLVYPVSKELIVYREVEVVGGPHNIQRYFIRNIFMKPFMCSVSSCYDVGTLGECTVSKTSRESEKEKGNKGCYILGS